MTIERDQYESLCPLSPTEVLETLSGVQAEIDVVEGEIDELGEQVKAKKQESARLSAKIAAALKSEKKPIYKLKGGELTTEVPAEPGMFDGQKTAEEQPAKDGAPLRLVGGGDAAPENREGDVRPDEEPAVVKEPECPAAVLEDISAYRNGYKSKEERTEAARRILAHIEAGGVVPVGMERKALRQSAKRVLAENGAQPPVAEQSASILATCGPNVNLLPVSRTDLFEKGDLGLLPGGEIVQIEDVRPRRRELLVKRAFRGTAGPIAMGTALRRLYEAGHPRPEPAAAAPTAAQL